MTYKCPVCGVSIANWVIKKQDFDCPSCNALLSSNFKKAFRQSLVVVFTVWLVFLMGMKQYSGSWGFAAAASIEGGGIISAMVAALYYRLVINIKTRSE